MEKINKRDVTVVYSEGENIYGEPGAVVVALAQGHVMRWTIREIPDEENWEDHYRFLFAQAHNETVDRKDEIIAEREMMKEMVAFLQEDIEANIPERKSASERADQIGLSLVTDEDEAPEAEVEPLPH